MVDGDTYRGQVDDDDDAKLPTAARVSTTSVSFPSWLLLAAVTAGRGDGAKTDRPVVAGHTQRNGVGAPWPTSHAALQPKSDEKKGARSWHAADLARRRGCVPFFGKRSNLAIFDVVQKATSVHLRTWQTVTATVLG